MKNKKPFAWSYSSLNMFEQCASKFYHLKIAKSHKEVYNAAADPGSVAHAEFENFLKDKTKKLPLDLKHHQPMLQRFKEVQGDGYYEQKLAITPSFTSTGFFDNDVWCRAVIDYLKVNPATKSAVVCDWKFGKHRTDNTQLKLFCAFVAIYFPEVENITACYYWAQDKEFTTFKIKSHDIMEMWNDILPRVQRIEDALSVTEFKANPSGLCKRHCCIDSCPYYQKGAF